MEILQHDTTGTLMPLAIIDSVPRVTMDRRRWRLKALGGRVREGAYTLIYGEVIVRLLSDPV